MKLHYSSKATSPYLFLAMSSLYVQTQAMVTEWPALSRSGSAIKDLSTSSGLAVKDLSTSTGIADKASLDNAQQIRNAWHEPPLPQASLGQEENSASKIQTADMKSPEHGMAAVADGTKRSQASNRLGLPLESKIGESCDDSHIQNQLPSDSQLVLIQTVMHILKILIRGKVQVFVSLSTSMPTSSGWRRNRGHDSEPEIRIFQVNPNPEVVSQKVANGKAGRVQQIPAHQDTAVQQKYNPWDGLYSLPGPQHKGGAFFTDEVDGKSYWLNHYGQRLARNKRPHIRYDFANRKWEWWLPEDFYGPGFLPPKPEVFGGFGYGGHVLPEDPLGFGSIESPQGSHFAKSLEQISSEPRSNLGRSLEQISSEARNNLGRFQRPPSVSGRPIQA